MIHIELHKLRTVRAPLILLAASQLIVAAGVSGLVLGGADLRDPQNVAKALAHAGLVSLFTLVLGIMAVAGEYRNKTITDVYLSEPRRGRVIRAKLAAYGIAGAVFGVCNAVTAMAALSIWWTAKGVPLHLSDPAIWRTIVGCFAANVAFAVIGVGVGALVRNVTAAVVIALAWLALIEGVVGQLIGDLARWLPFASGSALEDIKIQGSSVTPLPQLGAGFVLTGYAALFALVAVSTTVRRDVS